MDEATLVAGRLAELAARTEQHENLARALAYQGKAGNAIALIQARAVANEVDNDALHLAAWPASHASETTICADSDAVHIPRRTT